MFQTDLESVETVSKEKNEEGKNDVSPNDLVSEDSALGLFVFHGRS